MAADPEPRADLLRAADDPQLAMLAGAVRFAAGAGCQRHDEDPFFAFATLAALGFRAEVVDPAIATLNQVLLRIESGRGGGAEVLDPDQGRGSEVTSPSTTPSASPPPLPRSGLGLVAQRAGGTATGG